MMEALLFYLLSGVLLSAAAMVVTSRNTVHGVLFLILAFFNAAGLLILAHADFLAMMLVIVYVGAVAVLFLFVVMMIDAEGEGSQRQRTVKQYTRMGSFVGGVLVVELLMMATSWRPSTEAFDLTAAPFGSMPNTHALGGLIYTHYALIFQSIGLILLIAMVGAIVLTLRHRTDVKRQKVRTQLARDPKESLRLVNIPHGSGIQELGS